MKRGIRRAAWIGGVLIAVLLLALAATWRPSIDPVTPPALASLDREVVTRGAGLAHIGDCVVCHTAANGSSYAGGRALQTPFGTIYATNITPDVETGIGGWSRTAFVRAMRDGIARDGAHLYPAFPYDHFTRATEADLDDLYSFLMTRQPVKAIAPANQLTPPLGFRPLLAGWKLLFLHKDPIVDDPARPADWNRGHYLAESLAHCAACHTPRDAFGAEELARPYDGGWSDGWYAPPLNASSPAVRPWTADELFTYLRSGLSATHAAAAGPMGAVTRELAVAPEADVRAIAVYFASLMSGAPAGKRDLPAPDHAELAAKAHPEGAALFAGACAACHAEGAPMMAEGRPALSLGTPLHESSPRDTIQILLRGLKSPVGRAGPAMPAYGDTFTDQQLVDIAVYLRARYTNQPPWPDLPRSVAQARKEGAE